MRAPFGPVQTDRFLPLVIRTWPFSPPILSVKSWNRVGSSSHVSERNGGWGVIWALMARALISRPVVVIAGQMSEKVAIW